MEKLIRVVDNEKKIVQITTVDERWYARPVLDKNTSLPTYEYVPSVTWICDYYPKGVGFYKWLANTGWDEAQAQKEAAGGRGSKVHLAIVDLLNGFPININAMYENPNTGNMEELSLEEYEALISFVAWHKLKKPVKIAVEIPVWNDDYGYAGTVDFVCVIDDELWLIDFKTSKEVWPSHIIQVSAYKHTKEIQEIMKLNNFKEIKLSILQLGYKKNKLGYKPNDIEDEFDLFLAAKTIWAKETDGQKPKQKDYPVSISLDKSIKKEEVLA